MTIIFLVFSLWAADCSKWQKAEEIGLLPFQEINEASGLQVSKKIKNRLYHVNDSGDGPFLYITDFKGQNLQKVEVNHFYPLDVEDLTMARYDNKDYIVIGDIGDNLRIRSNIQLVFIEELAVMPQVVTPIHMVDVTYENKVRLNAEAFAYHPDGDIYIFSKEDDRSKKTVAPISVYKISKDVFLQKQTKAVAKLVGTIDLPKLQPKENWLGQIVTSMDIAPSGHWILLTYKKALYAKMQLNKSIPPVDTWKEGQDYMIIDILDFPQQEAISFVDDESSFLVTTEYKKKYKRAPISQVRCVSFSK